MTLKPVCENLPSLDDIPTTVNGIAQVKIMADNPEFLSIAIEKFLGKDIEEIKKPILLDLQGHLRALVATQTTENIHQYPDQFASLLREVAWRDLSKMGIEFVSFYIDDDFHNEKEKTEIAAISEENIDDTESEPLVAVRKRHWLDQLIQLKSYERTYFYTFMYFRMSNRNE